MLAVGYRCKKNLCKVEDYVYRGNRGTLREQRGTKLVSFREGVAYTRNRTRKKQRGKGLFDKKFPRLCHDLLNIIRDLRFPSDKGPYLSGKRKKGAEVHRGNAGRGSSKFGRTPRRRSSWTRREGGARRFG